MHTKQKIILVAGLFLMTFTFSSCKKSWICHCSNGVVLNGSKETSATVFADNNNEAVEKCNSKLNKNNDMFCTAKIND
ncbi:MAG: hypothetical protein M9897_10780 [Brumimicrobium sp.]|nr:hypothetical protein [Brumimicrobium sp.]